MHFVVSRYFKSQIFSFLYIAKEAERASSKSMELINAALLLSLLCFLFLLAKVIISKKPVKKRCKEAPEPWNLPFIGSLHRLLGSKLPHHTFRNLATVYGPIMRLKLGEINTVILSSAEGAREIMKTHDIVFANRTINTAAATITYGGNDIIFGPYGEFWLQMRRICNLELLSAKRVRSFRSLREEEVSRLIRAMAASSGTVVDFSRAMEEVSNNIMARAVIGSRCSDQKLFFEVLSEVVRLVSGFNAVDMFPSLPFLGRVSGYHRRLEQCRVRLDQMAEEIVEEHVEKRIRHTLNDEKDEATMEEDLTDVLLRIQREGSLQFPLANDNIKAVINDLLLAGSDTTTTILEWIMSELIQNPTIMKKAQKEVREVLGSINILENLSEDWIVGKLPYLHSVIKETFRLHPPLPLLLPRKNKESYEVIGYEIPAKSTVIINMWAIARDAKYWVEPDVFWPERFEESSLDFKGAHFEFTPFGAGRRICPGMQFGLATVEIVLSYLLYYFDWEYLGKKLDMTEAFGVTTRRESPLCIVPTLRFPLPSHLV